MLQPDRCRKISSLLAGQATEMNKNDFERLPRRTEFKSFSSNALVGKACPKSQLVPSIKAKVTMQTQPIDVYIIFGLVLLSYSTYQCGAQHFGVVSSEIPIDKISQSQQPKVFKRGNHV